MNLMLKMLDEKGEEHHLRVDDTGEFMDIWPEGFFDGRMPELF